MNKRIYKKCKAIAFLACISISFGFILQGCGDGQSSSVQTPPSSRAKTSASVRVSKPQLAPIANYSGFFRSKEELDFGPPVPQTDELGIVILGAYHQAAKKPTTTVAEWTNHYFTQDFAQGVFNQISRGRTKIKIKYVEEWRPYAIPDGIGGKEKADAQKCFGAASFNTAPFDYQLSKSLKDLNFNAVTDRIVVLVDCSDGTNLADPPVALTATSRVSDDAKVKFNGAYSVITNGQEFVPGIIFMAASDPVPPQNAPYALSDAMYMRYAQLPGDHPARNIWYEKGYDDCKQMSLPAIHKDYFQPIYVQNFIVNGVRTPQYITKQICASIIFHELAHTFGFRTTTDHTGGSGYVRAFDVSGNLPVLTYDMPDNTGFQRGNHPFDAVGSSSDDRYTYGWTAGTRFGAGFISEEQGDITRLKAPAGSSPKKQTVRLTSSFAPSIPGYQAVAIELPNSKNKIELWISYYNSKDIDGKDYEIFRTNYPKRQALVFELMKMQDVKGQGVIFIPPNPPDLTNARDIALRKTKNPNFDLLTNETLGAGESASLLGIKINNVQPTGDTVTFDVEYP